MANKVAKKVVAEGQLLERSLINMKVEQRSVFRIGK